MNFHTFSNFQMMKFIQMYFVAIPTCKKIRKFMKIHRFSLSLLHELQVSCNVCSQVAKNEPILLNHPAQIDPQFNVSGIADAGTCKGKPVKMWYIRFWVTFVYNLTSLHL